MTGTGSKNRALRWGLALLALHAILLLFPKIPPTYKRMSVVSYALSIAAVATSTVGFARAAPRITAWWRARRGPAWRATAVILAAGTLGVALAVRAAWPETFFRLSLEDGLWETLTLLTYGFGFVLVWDSGARRPREDRRARRAVAAGFALLALEEVDYFGLFGGVIGRIDGVYAGSLHDVVRLVAEGVMGPVAVGVFVVAIALVLVALWRAGWFAPRRTARLVAGPEIAWAAAGLAILAVAASEEAHLFGWVAARPTPEEAIELAGGACLAVWSLELVARLAPPESA